MADSRFIERNEAFVCLHCGMHVLPHQTSSRDHCTACLYSLHVDIHPGDRKNECRGLMEPIGIDQRNQKMKIAYRCTKCKEKHMNIVAEDDNKDLIAQLANFDW